jgi:hypothetical protein
MVKVDFDSSLKLYMVSPSAWTATGATQWFKNYRIISALDNALAPKLGIVSLQGFAGETPKTTKEIIRSPLLKKVIHDENLEDYTMLLNRASSNLPDTLGNSYELVSHYENKVWLRKNCADRISFAPFRILSLHHLHQHGFSWLKDTLASEVVVIQHASLAGGRGTYVVATADEFALCLESLGTVIKEEDEVVVSAFVKGYERTLQVCVTKDGVLVGPPQAQLVGHPTLTSPRPGDIQFCGGRIAPGLMNDSLYQQASHQAHIIGETLQQAGYKGIFGMDFLISKDRIYTLEVNPRMTGLTTLLAFLQKDVPFLLLHILELAASPYAITTPSPHVDTGSFIQVYAQKESRITFESGRYDRAGRRIGEGFEDGNILPADDDECFVAMRVAKDAEVQQGKSLAFIYSRRQLFTDDGEIDSAAALLADKIRG